MRLKNKVAIITGAGGGIGAVTAKTFAREGAKVAAIDRAVEAGQRVAGEIIAAGGAAYFQAVDVTDAAAVQTMVEQAVARFGGIDILVNNAGITRDARLVRMEPAQWDAVLNVNLRGVFLCGQAVARVMEAQGRGGVILNAASVVGLYGNFGQSNYVASKAGLIGMTKTWARELGRSNIRVNAVAPGFIATEMIKTIPEKVVEMIVQRTPLGRMGDPQDIANAYLFLASDEAKFITGTVLSVDGGIVT